MTNPTLDAILAADPYWVDSDKGVRLIVLDTIRQELPASFALMGTLAEHRVVCRIGGGCKNMTPSDKSSMMRFFAKEFKGYRGLVWSGGTRMATADGRIDPMVTDVTGMITRLNPGSVGLATVPRTGTMKLAPHTDSRLVLDDYGTAPSPGVYAILIVEDGPDANMDWNGDLDTCFRLIRNWREHGGFSQAAWVSWNGGAVTEEEVRRSVLAGYPTILVRGSGRVTDEIANAFLAGSLGWLPPQHSLLLAHKDQPGSLRRHLIAQGLLRP
jgi:hypothetical protein